MARKEIIKEFNNTTYLDNVILIILNKKSSQQHYQ